ncbi:MAG: bifunctional rhamnulose-1-phosphate aldolase/short-chain dehydrogenase [Candidatus Omnitrophica bacterium CG11_big_fil_rev_8_21_14_0_20_63_9]|nr:MAG: bifunctional rhamnulose-1-phosphate aldolase/short-chain dehydrogenase [Candidatus Omnitrophica bacterium CG11_big_fil_rev_8_21_14_0_20_63_9]
MRNRWDDRYARRLSPLEALVYRSRLLGAEPTLGLFGGGNTSSKWEARDVLGQPQSLLWVKGSGADLRTCDARHFAPLQLQGLRRLSQRRSMSDDEMMALLERCLTDLKAPRPSVETLLHAFIPEQAVDHTHADAILALANTPQGQRWIRQALGPDLLWIPYIQPGFALCRRVFEAYQRHPGAHGAVLQHHGLMTWGADGRTSFARTIACVSRAERFLTARRTSPRNRHASAAIPVAARRRTLRAWLPAIRRTISAQRKMHVTLTATPDILAFLSQPRLIAASRRGPATPDHMLRTKRLPLTLSAAQSTGSVIRALQRYTQSHARYFEAYHAPGQQMLDPSPRVMLVPQVGMLTTGKDATEAQMVAEIFRHAIAIMQGAARIEAYTSISARAAFGVEYWPLELYKLSLAPPEAELAREIGLITGAAGGIGRAIAQHLVDHGASVVVADLRARDARQLAEALNRRAGRLRALGVAMDVTRERGIEQVLDQALEIFGGLDFVVSNAGIADVASIDRLPLKTWERSLAVNATGHFLVARAAVRFLRAQGLGGALVFIASKNVLAPGRDFGAYSAAKAAEAQLARVLAIENGEANIRVNVVHPDGVFDGSGLWEAIRAERAKSHRIAPRALEEHYRKRNLLQARVLPEDVAEAVSFFISKRSAKTTGCLLTVDGGLREAFPR